MQKISFKKFNWWISNDEVLWLPWSQKMIEWVDILNHSQYVKLAKWFNDVTLRNTRYNGEIVGSSYSSYSTFLEISQDGNITNFENWGKNYLIHRWFCSNIWRIHTWTTSFWFILKNTWIILWNYIWDSSTLWMIDWWDWINTDPWFDNDWNWTIWAWWTVNWEWAHTSWTDTLSRTSTSVSWTKYRFELSWNTNAGSCDVKLWWVVVWTFDKTNNEKLIFERTATWDNDKLEFVPTDDFDWWIDNNYIQKELFSEYSHTLQWDKSPYLVYWNYIYVWNWNKITRIDLTVPTVPVFTDFSIINWDYTIKWMSRIWDQFFIYASNGSNSKQYLWNWVDKEAQRVITWVDKPIQNVANFGNVDYVITGTEHRQTLSVVSWYRLQPLINTREYVNSWDRIYFNTTYTNSVETIVNKLLIAWNDWVYSYWTVMPTWYSYSWQMQAFSDVLNKEYIWINWTITNMFFDTTLWYNLYVYFKWNYNWVYWNYKVQYYLPEWDNNAQYIWEWYGTTWWIETKPYFGAEYSNIKNLNKYVVWYKLETSTYLLTYIKDKSYVNIYTTDNRQFNVWDVYSCNWVNYTIKSINNHILNCETSSEIKRPVVYEFTKVSWTWPATFKNVKMRLWYRLLNKIDDTTKNKYTWYITEATNKIEFAIELVTTNSKNSPRLYNFDIYFDEINQDD